MFTPFLLPAGLVFLLFWERKYRKQGERAFREYAATHTPHEAIGAQMNPSQHCPYNPKTQWRRHCEWCKGFEWAVYKEPNHGA